jgi:hypothetical protein
MFGLSKISPGILDRQRVLSAYYRPIGLRNREATGEFVSEKERSFPRGKCGVARSGHWCFSKAVPMLPTGGFLRQCLQRKCTPDRPLVPALALT